MCDIEVLSVSPEGASDGVAELWRDGSPKSIEFSPSTERTPAAA